RVEIGEVGCAGRLRLECKRLSRSGLPRPPAVLLADRSGDPAAGRWPTGSEYCFTPVGVAVPVGSAPRSSEVQLAATDADLAGREPSHVAAWWCRRTLITRDSVARRVVVGGIRRRGTRAA